MPVKLKKSADGTLFVVYECPDCGSPQRNLAEMTGKSSRCKACGSNILIPGEEIYRSYLSSVGATANSPEPPPLRLDDDAPPSRTSDSYRYETPKPRRSALDRDIDSSGMPYRSSRYAQSQGDFDDDYISMTSMSGESVRLQFGPATAAVLAAQILLGIMSFLWLLTIAGVVMTGRNDFRDRPTVAFGGTLIMLLYGFCILVLPALIFFLRIVRRKYTITNERVVSRSGLASLSVNDVRTESISGISISQTLFGRLFGYGTVRVHADGTSVKLIAVDHPVAVAAAVRTVVERS